MNTTKRYHNREVASAPSNGVVNPDFSKISEAYKIPHYKLSDVEDIVSYIVKSGPMILEIDTEPFEFIGPKLMQSHENFNELINMFPFLEPSILRTIVDSL